MTYIPNILTKNDSNNTFQNQTTTQTGTATLTTGYESINITIDKYDEDSNPGGLEIQFSIDNTISNFKTYYSDTYYKNTVFNKSYKILNKYYRIIYTPSGSSSFNLSTILTTNSNSNINTINNYYSNNHDSIYDAFAKIRVSNPNTLLDIKFPSQSDADGDNDFLDNKCLLCTKTTGNAPTITRGDSKKIISITGTGTFISQSRKYCVYQPGKSQLVLLSGILKDSAAGSAVYENYIGYFDDNNGLFFKYDTTNNISVNLRSSSSTNSISQSSWNIDKLDGNGTSGYNLDFEKSQLFVIDFEWLSVGRIRFGFYIFGKIYYCHQIHNVNELDGPYMKTANLPIRYQINVTSGTAKLTQICSSVISEGGYNPIGKSFSISNGISNTSGISVGTSLTGIIALRGSDVSNKYNHENILPTELSILDDSKRIMLIQIRLYHPDALPTVGSWTQVNDNSVVQYATTDISNLTASHIVLKQFYVSEQSNFTLNLDSIFNNFLQITSDIDNTSDILVITGQTVSGSGKVYASLGWQEIY